MAFPGRLFGRFYIPGYQYISLIPAETKVIIVNISYLCSFVNATQNVENLKKNPHFDVHNNRRISNEECFIIAIPIIPLV